MLELAYIIRLFFAICNLQNSYYEYKIDDVIDANYDHIHCDLIYFKIY